MACWTPPLLRSPHYGACFSLPFARFSANPIWPHPLARLLTPENTWRGKTLNSPLREQFSASAGQKRDSTARVSSWLVPLPLIPGSELCPVSATRHDFSLVPASSRSPIFGVPNGRHFSPLTSSTFANTFKKLVSSSDSTLRTSHHTFSVTGVPPTRSRQVSPNTFSKSMVTGVQKLTNCTWPCLCPLAHRLRTQCMAAGLYQPS